MAFPANPFEQHAAHQRALRDQAFQAFMQKVLGAPRCPDWKPGGGR